MSRYPDYHSAEEQRAHRNEDLKKYGDLEVRMALDLKFLFHNNHAAPLVVKGAPVETAPIGLPVAYPKGSSDFLTTFRSVMQNKDFSKLEDREVRTR